MGLMVKRLAQTPKSVRLGEQVANLLLAAIRLHEYLPGQRLPSERELCLRLGVNRMAVREGLRWLEHQQYIEIRRGRYGGAFVRAPGAELALERLRGKAEQLRQLFEYRAAIEPLAAALAAERITDPDIFQLRRLLQEQENEESRPRRRALDVEFHEVIATAARNEFVFNAVREIRIGLATGLDIIQGSPARVRESFAEHVEILRALETHSASSAREAMQLHVLGSERMIRRAMIEFSATDAGEDSAENPASTAAPGVVIGASSAEAGQA
jgi:GntR family transcriptional regulator, transcriptional repressor for pyruvate dehydrogenase complex